MLIEQVGTMHMYAARGISKLNGVEIMIANNDWGKCGYHTYIYIEQLESLELVICTLGIAVN